MVIKSILTILTTALLLSACAAGPSKPPTYRDDGRGLVALNPDMVTEDEYKAVRKKHRRSRIQKIDFN